MRHLNNRRAFVVQPFEHVHDFLALGRMKVAGRFVSQNQPRVRNHRTGDADKLLLSTRQLSWIEIFLADDLKAVERVTNDRLPVLAADVAIRERQLEIFEDCLIVDQVIALKNKTDVPVS